MSTQTLQFRLSMNNGLDAIWEQLTRRYQGMDKASIIRLALNTLAREDTQPTINTSPTYSMVNDALPSENPDAAFETEEEVFEWWNKNKSKFRT